MIRPYRYINTCDRTCVLGRMGRQLALNQRYGGSIPPGRTNVYRGVPNNSVVRGVEPASMLPRFTLWDGCWYPAQVLTLGDGGSIPPPIAVWESV